MNEREALILLNGLTGLGPMRLKRLLGHFRSPQDIFGASAADLMGKGGLPIATAEAILKAPRQRDDEAECERAEKEGIHILTLWDETYPALLKEIHDAPIVLYVKGELKPQDDLSLSIVGSRRASPYGIGSALQIARELVGYGFTIVSGFARGIDTAAHQGALLAKGRTIAVLGSGLLEIYPSENNDLVIPVADSGALVSEFPLHEPALPTHFPQRNRIISGLSLGVLVVEADGKSGALITAAAAMEQGREVFALPGRVDSPLSRGTHRLIQEGAKLVQELADILEELKIPIAQHTTKEIFTEKLLPSLSEGEQRIYGVLSDVPKTVDDIVGASHISAPVALSTLVQLEVKQLVRVCPGNRYTRR